MQTNSSVISYLEFCDEYMLFVLKKARNSSYYNIAFHHVPSEKKDKHRYACFY